MIATDFIFNDQRASDFDLIICSFNGELQPASGGNVEFEIVKPPESDKFSFYGAQYNDVLEWTFSIIKNPCIKNNQSNYFSTEEERQIYKWLQQRDGYHWFSFCQDENEDDIYYNVKINLTPQLASGKTIGFDLTVTSDSAFGYTALQKKKAIINENTPLILYIDTDTNNYILPGIKISGTGNFYISNDSDTERNISNNKASSFSDVIETIFMDSENGFINGLMPNDFNWYFLRLVDGKNVITTNSTNDITLEIFYREVRRVVV